MKARIPLWLAIVTAVAEGGCGHGPAPSAAPTLLDVHPAAVHKIILDAGGRRAEFTQSGDRVWRAGRGATDEGAALLLGAEERLFPLRGYRRMRLDGRDPAFGFDAPAAILTVDIGTGPPRTVAIGAATFNGGGFYARLGDAGDDVYLVARAVLADLRSLAEGRPVTLPQVEDARINKALRGNDQQEADGPAQTRWLRQAVDSGATLPEVGR
jgi:hypothetical protein